LPHIVIKTRYCKSPNTKVRTYERKTIDIPDSKNGKIRRLKQCRLSFVLGYLVKPEGSIWGYWNN